MNATQPLPETCSARRWIAPMTLGILALTLAGCGSTSSDRSGGSIARGKYKPYRSYVVGVPYKIRDIRYYPKENLAYNQVGIASWYGPGFNGKRTANGEQYNQNAMTAAHPTLPMPTIVKVTNLQNGRSIVVRVNDRGPFASDRIIDLSKEAARRIKMIRHGTARVRVRVLRDETLALKRSGQVYADMAALNRRYVDGTGSGTVISAENPAPPKPKSARKQLAVRPLPKPPLTNAAVGSNTGSGTNGNSVNAAGRIVSKPLDRNTATKGPIRITPKSYARPSDRGDRKSWGNDIPPSDRNSVRTPKTSKSKTRNTANPATVRKPVVAPAPVAGRIFVQAAAYTEKSKARRVRSTLGNLAKSKVTAVQIRQTIFYRVRLGPCEHAGRRRPFARPRGRNGVS